MLNGYTFVRQVNLLVAGSIALFASASMSRADELDDGFKNPPVETKPGVYWYWVTDNISKDGITRDLEAMARVGIGRAFIGNVDIENERRGTVKVLSEEWFDLVRHAVREGKRTGVKVGMFNCPGWSMAGGPWVTPQQTMRYVVSSETHVTGPSTFNATLPKPNETFQDIAVLAYPQPAFDTDSLANHQPTITSNIPAADNTPAAVLVDGKLDKANLFPWKEGQGPVVIDVNLAEAYLARSLVLHLGAERFQMQCELLAEDDAGAMKPIKSFYIDRSNGHPNVGPMVFGPVSVAFPEVKSKHFQVRLTPNNGNLMSVTEIAISSAARMERMVEKQLGKMNNSAIPAWDAYVWPSSTEPQDSSAAIPSTQVQNISSHLQPNGTLTWDVPAGDWIVTRIGMTPTGLRNSPASAEGVGLEIDKINRSVIKPHIDSYIGKVLEHLTPDERASFGNVIADSYEMGSTNWTDGFDGVFKQRYGYDPIPWLPVFSGRLVGSATQSERFLWDIRRLVADLVATEFVGGLRKEVNSHGLKLWLENYGHWGFPSDFMKYGSESDEIGGEFWMGWNQGDVELRAAASCAHVYNKPLVSAEAFTAGGDPFQHSPWDLKLRGDWAMSQGINHFVLHVYIQQAYEDRKPGVCAWFGTEFNRHNIWFEESKYWIDYLRRSHFLLQHGSNVADVAYFTGEDAPKMSGSHQPPIPAGYNFDDIDAASILRLHVEDGKLVLPHGTSYRLLVLPPLETMRPDVIAKLKELVAGGGAILGPKPLRSPSLQDYPACDQAVQGVADAVWQDCDGKVKTSIGYGKGTVFNGITIDAALKAIHTVPDVSGLNDKVNWLHRQGKGLDVYYLTSQSDAPSTFGATFRVSGRHAECWDAVHGERRALTQTTTPDGMTQVSLSFAPRQSLFVVFRDEQTQGLFPANSAPTTLATLAGPWIVNFQPAIGEHFQKTFDQLIDWAKHPDIQIQHFSGRATYQNTFELADVAAHRRFRLNLGALSGMAHVRINGKDIGSIWCAPWDIDITDTVKQGANQLEVDVYNNWVNQLLGDAQAPAEQRTTWTSIPNPIDKNRQPQSSGLLGSVTITTE